MRLTILYIFFLMTLFPSQNIFSQKEDFVWYTGVTGFNAGGATFYHFNETGNAQLNLILDDSMMIRDGSGKATMADSEGNLLFYTDGFDVFNRNHQIMTNGDSVFQMTGTSSIYYEQPGGLNIPDWSLILPCPADPDIYFLFYRGIKNDEKHPSNFRGTGLYYSKIDMAVNEEDGAVVEKNVNLIELRSVVSSLKGIRHANGRDWWIPVMEMENERWHVFLLDDHGVHFSHITEVGEFPAYHCWFSLYNYKSDQFVCMTGDHFYPWEFFHDRPFEYDFHVYDFDRCAGTFHYSNTFELETWSLKYALKTLTFCPNGRFLYGGLGYSYLIQYDTWADNVQATADTLLNIYTMGNAISGIYEPKITPRGELWLQHWQSDSMTVIQNPEMNGSEVNISEDFIETTWLNQGTFPNNANYRIGPVDGSPCDTLGIDNLPKAWFRYNGANLGHFERRFTDISYFRPENWHWDFGDGTTYDGQHPGVHEFPEPRDYYVCLTVSNENSEDTYCEWVAIEGPSNLREQLDERGFVLFPNPNRGQFHLHFTEDLREGGELRMYNMLGQMVYSRQLEKGLQKLSLDAAHLPSGQYIVRIRAGGELFSQGVMVME